MTKPVLILQLRPEDEVSDNEFTALIKAGSLENKKIIRLRMEKDGLSGVNLENYSAVVVGGGPYCISDLPKPAEQLKFEEPLKQLLKQIIDQDFPYFGACYGLSILAVSLGGEVSKEKYSEGVRAVTINLSQEAEHDVLCRDLPKEFKAFGGHKESCQTTPERSVVLASSEQCPVHMIRVKNNIYATQFHPELDSEGLAVRINAYRNMGYFPPEEADSLIALAQDENVTVPEQIFKRFINRYCQ